MSTALNNFLSSILRFHTFLLGAAPSQYTPRDIRYWLQFDDLRMSVGEGLAMLEDEFVALLRQNGINVNSLDEAQAEIERIAQARPSLREDQQQVWVIPPDDAFVRSRRRNGV